MSASGPDEAGRWQTTQRVIAVTVTAPTAVQLNAPLDDALPLIEECRGGGNADDFRHEFLSYWIIATDHHAPVFVSLMCPHGPSREVVVWRGKGERTCAETVPASIAGLCVR